MPINETKKKLEFERIVNRIKHFTYSDLGSEKCDVIEFYSDAGNLEYELNKVVEMKEILNIANDLPLEGLSDI